MGGFFEGQVMTSSDLDNLFHFAVSLGYDYNGIWTSKTKLVITIISEDGAGPPIPGVFTVTVKASGNLRNFPAACAPTVRSLYSVSSFSLRLIKDFVRSDIFLLQVITSGALAGAFGKSTIEIVKWEAGHPPGGGKCRGYVTGVTMTVEFSEITNRALQGTKISRTEVDLLFSFKYNMGQNYIGEWKDDKTIVITISDPFGASPPEVGSIIGQVNSFASLHFILLLCA